MRQFSNGPHSPGGAAGGMKFPSNWWEPNFETNVFAALDSRSSHDRLRYTHRVCSVSNDQRRKSKQLREEIY